MSELAFPNDSKVFGDHPGMTIRDYFAAAALTGLLANVDGTAGMYKTAAFDAYEHADAMIEAREETV